MTNWQEFFTLKRRIVLIFLFISILMFIGIGLVSYLAIVSILNDKINTSIQRNLAQINLALSSSIADLNHVSQQLTAQGLIGHDLDLFLSTSDPYQRVNLIDKMKTNLNLITFTNPGVGLVMYYFKNDHSTLLENSSLRKDFNPEQLPIFASGNQINYYGPHISQDSFSDQFVLSAFRKMDLTGRDDVYIYLETNFKLAQSILETDTGGMETAHLMLDNDGRIVYSELPAIFPLGSVFDGGGDNSQFSGQINNYYWFKATSFQGWSIVSVIASSEYNREKDQWITRMATLLIVFLLFNSLVAFLLWDFVYRPLNKFDSEIRTIERGDFKPSFTRTRIPEFDFLFERFQQMKKQISDLFIEVQNKEKIRADLEIEKLLYQINPHFLMNTLDTAHWLAVMKNQDEIDNIIQSLNKLLAYNLGKIGRVSTLKDELAAVQQYLLLQQFRHEFTFEVSIPDDQELLNEPIPRFILQPIVENAIYHGLSKQGHIIIRVVKTDLIELSVCDNGTGMASDKINELLDNKLLAREKLGMGIGMNYVKRMLEAHYSGRAKLHIESELGKGTSVWIYLPFEVKAI